MSKGKRNWLIDTALFIGFLLTFFLDLTGLAWHQWLGVGVGLIMLYHLLVHWKWVIAVTRRFFGRTSSQSRIYYLIDLSMLLSGMVIGFSGLLISTWVSINYDNYLFWQNLHIWSSIASLVFMLIKISIHWRWIIKTGSKHFGLWRKPMRARASVPIQSISAPRGLNRREFLQLMGVTSLASLISVSNLLEFGQKTGQEIIKSQFFSSSVAENDPSSIECTVICDQGCTYPGECRRYVDQNGNGICDLTECMSDQNNSGSQPDSSQVHQDQVDQTPAEEEITLNTAEDCVVLCPSACAYPGECKDYIDNNGNNLCDLGECLVNNTTVSTTTIHRGRQNRGGK